MEVPTMKTIAINVPGSVITAQTAAAYLARIAADLLGSISVESALVLNEIEERIVNAGFLTWEQVEEIEANA